MAGAPAVRARHMKSLLATVDRLPATEAEAVRRRVEPTVLAGIADASGVEWLPVAWNVALTRAIHDALGVERFRRFFRAEQLESFRGPLLKYVVDGVIHLLGIDLGSWVRWIPKGWGLVFRDCGSWSVGAVEPGRATLLLDALPPECFDDAVWHDSVAASLEALLDLASSDGSLTVEGVDRAQRRVAFVLRWGPPAGR